MEDILPLPKIKSIEEATQPESEVLPENGLDVLAHRLAKEYILSQQITGEPVLLHLLQHQEKVLNRAYQNFNSTSQDDITPSSAAEWLLDNFFVLQQAIRQIREDMPSGYYQQLPKLANTPL